MGKKDGSMANIIPMAGLGSRYTKEGYTLPKPLIPVSGKPMIIRAIENMPPSDKWIFIVREEHITQYAINRLLKSVLKNPIIIPVKKTTEGQACTCMLAKPYINDDEPVFIAACDNGYLYDKKQYAKLCNDKKVDAVVWTFSEHENLRKNPKAWGWVQPAKGSNIIEGMSVKMPVSDDPFHDHAVVASFYFRRAADFSGAVDLMIKENYRINNEFYVDAVPIFLQKMGKRSAFFDIDLYVGWGTPQDLYIYQEWEYLSVHAPKNAPPEKQKDLKLWQRYFQEKRG